MIVKLYFLISLFTVLIFLFTVKRCLNYLSDKYDLSPIRNKKRNMYDDIAAIIEMVIICFIPIFNILFIICVLGMYEELQDVVEEKILEKYNLERRTDYE